MKKLLENKSYGFYVTFVSVVASIVCAAVYASMYSGSRCAAAVQRFSFSLSYASSLTCFRNTFTRFSTCSTANIAVHVRNCELNPVA